MRSRYLLLAVILVPLTAVGAEWTPPVNPDPVAILREARADAEVGKYEVALEKHLWFHRNALSIQESLAGVRLSFALSYWQKLGEKYPQATQAMEEVRDEALQALLAGRKVRNNFHDMRSLNLVLGEESRTKDVFKTLHRTNREAATKVFSLAQRALVLAKEYELCGEYIDPRSDFSLMQKLLEYSKRRSRDPKFGERHLKSAQQSFANDAALLVAILAVNGRRDEAEEIAALARAEYANDRFHEQLARSLKGVVPTPWP